MKNLKSNLIVLALLPIAFAFAMVGCKKDDSDHGSITVDDGSLTASLDNQAWQSSSEILSAIFINNTTNISGRAYDGSFITITIFEYAEIGKTYDLGMNGDGIAIYNTQANLSLQPWTSKSSINGGTFTVTEIDSSGVQISGTFSFEAYRSSDNTSRQITSGVFSHINFTRGAEYSGTIFTSWIDGIQWGPNTISASINQQSINIVASESIGAKSITLTLPSDISIGGYNLMPGSPYTAYYNDGSNQMPSVIPSAMQITSHNMTTHRIEGRFNFKTDPLTGGPPGVIINGGSFSVVY